MRIENIPDKYFDLRSNTKLYIYDFKMTKDVVKSKVNLSINMFRFLRVGRKQVHFADTAIEVSKAQSL